GILDEDQEWLEAKKRKAKEKAGREKAAVAKKSSEGDENGEDEDGMHDGDEDDDEGMEDLLNGLEGDDDDEEDDEEDEDLAQFYTDDDDDEEGGQVNGSMDDKDDDDPDTDENLDEFVLDPDAAEENPDEEFDLDEPLSSSKQPSKSTKDTPALTPADPAKPDTKYIPPHLRNAAPSSSSSDLRLRSTLQGHLNRLSDANLSTTLSLLESIYRTNPRALVTTALTDLILVSLGDRDRLLESFVMTHAALIAALQSVMGQEVPARFVQALVERYRASLVDLKKEGMDGAAGKRAVNLATVLCCLYNLDVVGVLRASGGRMRGDDPGALKEIVGMVQKKAEGKELRTKFMIETIMDLKNNKRKSKKGAGGAPDDLQAERLKKFLGNLSAKRGLPDREALRVTFKDIAEAKTRGQWWLVGAAWAGRDTTADNDDGGGDVVDAGGEEDVDGVAAVVGGAGVDLLRLARAQRMNTDVRRSIFVVLMSSEDCVDAHDRLLRLRLKDKQEREIPRVLLHCAGAEKTYNPFYALVASRFCGAGATKATTHAFRITFQFALWDAIRAFEEGEGDGDGEKGGEVRKVSNLARFYAFLIGGGFLGLTILKTLDFTALSRLPALFSQILFTRLLAPTITTTSKGTRAKAEDDTALAPFERLVKVEDSEPLRDGIAHFLTEAVMPKKDGSTRSGLGVAEILGGKLGEEAMEVLRRRVKGAKRMLVDGLEE
ncbi:suppressor of glycerol defect, partial [Irineochytrium annulatum]